MPEVRSQSLSLAVHGERYLSELRNHGREESTIKTYGDRLRWFGEWLLSTAIALADVTRDTIEQYLSDLKIQDYSDKHIRDQFSAIRSFLQWLEDREFIHKNPIRGVKPPKVGKKIPEVRSAEEVKRWIDAAKTPRELALLELLYGGGFRRFELLGMDVADLRLDENKILIVGKGNKQALQPITSKAADSIRAWLPERESYLVSIGRSQETALFVSMGGKTRGRRLGATGLANELKEIYARAELEGRAYPHLVRHCYGTHLLEGGARLEQVQDLLRHDNINTTRIYTHISQTTLQKAVKEAHPRAADEKEAKGQQAQVPVTIRLSPDELARCHQLSHAKGLTLEEWIRRRLVR